MDEILKEFGFVVTARKTHAIEYCLNTIVLYYIPSDKLNLVISPEDYVLIKELNNVKYHNNNMTLFPKEKNNGERKINYGFKIVFEDAYDLRIFLVDYIKIKNR